MIGEVRLSSTNYTTYIFVKYLDEATKIWNHRYVSNNVIVHLLFYFVDINKISNNKIRYTIYW